jgi:hypothetical protein
MLCSSTYVTEVKRTLIEAIRHVTAVPCVARMATSFLYRLGTDFDIFRYRNHVKHIDEYSGVLEGPPKYSLTEISAAEAN